MKDLFTQSTIEETVKHQLLVEFNNTEVDYPTDKTVIDLFEKQAEESPKAVAVIFEEKQLT